MASEACVICGGARGEHGNSQHMFSLIPGQLITKEQYEKDQPKKIPLPHDKSPLGRLIEVLVVRGVIDLPEALYVADLGPRPEHLQKGAHNGNGS